MTVYANLASNHVDRHHLANFITTSIGITIGNFIITWNLWIYGSLYHNIRKRSPTFKFIGSSIKIVCWIPLTIWSCNDGTIVSVYARLTFVYVYNDCFTSHVSIRIRVTVGYFVISRCMRIYITFDRDILQVNRISFGIPCSIEIIRRIPLTVWSGN